MNRNRVILFVLCFSSLLLAGCKKPAVVAPPPVRDTQKEEQLVGSWELEGSPYKAKHTYHKDGRFGRVVTGAHNNEASGTWKIVENFIYLSFTASTLDAEVDTEQRLRIQSLDGSRLVVGFESPGAPQETIYTYKRVGTDQPK